MKPFYSLLMLEHGFIAPSINIEELDDKADGMNIIYQTNRAKTRYSDVK